MTEPIEHTMAEEFMAEGFYTKAALVELITRARDLGPVADISDAIQKDGSLLDVSLYLRWSPGEDEATIDGYFTAPQLRAIVLHMEKHKAPAQEPGQ